MSSVFRKKGPQIVVFQPYGLLRTSAAGSEYDFETVVAWLECIFGPGSVDTIWYKLRATYIIVKLKDVSNETVAYWLGNHAWIDILDRPRSNEKNGASQLFLFNKDGLEADAKGFNIFCPKPNPKPPHFRVKNADLYPRPSWCLIPVHDNASNIALPFSKEDYDSATSLISAAPKPINLTLYEEKNLSWGMQASDGWQGHESSSVQESSIATHSFKSDVRPVSETTKSQIGEKYLIRVKDEFVEPLLSPSPSPSIKPDSMGNSMKMEPTEANLETYQNIYLVLFNPIGFNRRNPSDLSQVRSWLESDQLFGFDSIQGFWTRCLDIRVIASVWLTPRQVIPCLGRHRWVDSIAQRHATIDNESSHIFMLIPQLWNKEALQANGFLPTPVGGHVQPLHYFRKSKASDFVLEADPPDHQMDGIPITEKLDKSWKRFSEVPVKTEIKLEVL